MTKPKPGPTESVLRSLLHGLVCHIACTSSPAQVFLSRRDTYNEMSLRLPKSLSRRLSASLPRCLAASLPLFRSLIPCFAQVKDELDTAVKLVGEGGLNLAVMGHAAELEKLKNDLGPLGCKFYVLDSGKRFRYKFMTICYC